MASLYGIQFTQRIGIKNAVSSWQLYNDVITSTGFCGYIAADFVSRMVPIINAAQGSYVKNVSVYVLNLTNGLCSDYRLVEGEGERTSTGNDVPAFFTTATVRWAVGETQYGPRSTPIKRGFNRLCGLLDDDIIDGQLAPDSVSSFLDPISNEWRENVSVSGFTYTPVIHVPGVGSSPQYKIAPIVDIVGWHIGSQNSRKQR